jgi:ABC-type sugar transport system, auxiliary component
MEDIINRGGGNLLIQLYNSTEEDKFSDSPVTASVDGRNFEIPAGGMIRLTPGESISLHRRVYHKFWAEEGHGPVLLGEVSMLNDDDIDNRFYDGKPRFTRIEEDVPALYRLCNEY